MVELLSPAGNYEKMMAASADELNNDPAMGLYTSLIIA